MKNFAVLFEYNIYNEITKELAIQQINKKVQSSKRRFHNSELFLSVGDTFERYLSGEIDAKEAAKLINKKAQIIFNE